MRRLKWLSLSVIVSLGLVLLAGTALAQGPEPPQQVPPAQPPSILSYASTQAGDITNLFYIVFWIGVGIFVLVQSLLIIALIRFRRRPDHQMPAQVHGSTALEIAWTIIPAVILIVLLAFTLRAMQSITATPRDNPLRVEVVGHQWWWEFRYTDAAAEGAMQGVTSTVTTAGEMYIPVERPVQLQITAVDVIHSFWVPQLGGKTDAIPNYVRIHNILAKIPGRFPGQCAEFCGPEHALMRFEVIATPATEFDAWLAGQQAPATLPVTGTASADLMQGYQLFSGAIKTSAGGTMSCQACHTVRGTRAAGQQGPDLTHVGSRLRIVSGILDNTPDNMYRWIQDPQAIKPGALMPKLPMSDAERRALAAFLESLK